MLLDDNADGKLSREELINGFEKYQMGDSDDVDYIIKTCDVDGNGFLEYTEFVAATMNRKKMMSKESLK